MADLILYRSKICGVVCNEECDVIRFVDRDHVLHIVERDKVKLLIDDHDRPIYYILDDENVVTSYYYDEYTEEAKCSLTRLM